MIVGPGDLAPAAKPPRTLPGGVPLESIWVALVAILPCIGSLVAAVLTIDLAYHIRAGETIISDGAVLRTDGFSFVDHGASWLNQQWGAQVLLAVLYKAGGFATLAAFRAVLAGCTGFVLFLACRGRGADRRTAAMLALGGLTIAFPSLGLRPQMLGLVFFAIALWVVVGRAAHSHRLWLLPVLAIMWANTHGSFFLLPVLILLAFAESASRRGPDTWRLGAVGLLSLAATGIGPFGYGVWTYAIDVGTDPAVRQLITEWAPTSLTDVEGWLLFGSGLATAGYLARRGGIAWTDLVGLGGFFLAAVATRRAIPWWGFVLAVVLAGLLPHRRDEQEDRSRANTMLLAGLVAATLVLLPWWRSVRLEFAPETLVRATAGVTQQGDRLFVFQPWASWFEFRLRDRPVFVDSRIELFSESVWLEYHAVGAGRSDWMVILDRWEVDVLVAPPMWPVVPFIREDPTWRLVRENRTGLVFVRD